MTLVLYPQHLAQWVAHTLETSSHALLSVYYVLSIPHSLCHHIHGLSWDTQKVLSLFYKLGNRGSENLIVQSHRQKGVENYSSNSCFSNCKVQTLILCSPVIDKPQHRYGYQSAYVRITWGANTDSENNLEKLTEWVSVWTKSWHF